VRRIDTRSSSGPTDRLGHLASSRYHMFDFVRKISGERVRVQMATQAEALGFVVNVRTGMS
jgi:hypothetical protein